MSASPNRALALLASTQFLLIMDTAIINVAAPSIGRELDLSAATLSWVANAYLVTFGGLLVLSGRAADMLARRRLFVAGLCLLAAASAAGSVAGSAGLLIAARALQGAGAAVAAAAAFALLLALFPDGTPRHRALGVFAAMAGAGGAAGTVLGGLLTDWLSWRSTFALNVVAGLVLVLLAVRMLDEGRPSATERTGFDLAGAVSVTVGLALVAYSMVNTGVAGWTASSTLIAGAVGLLLLAAFVVVQRHGRSPLVPPAALKIPMLVPANLLSAIGQFALFPMFFLISVYMQAVLGYPPVLGGLALLPLTVVVILTAGRLGSVIARFGLRPVATAGFVLVTAGMLWLSRLSADGSFVGDVLFPSLVLGVGLPTVAVTTNVAATSRAGAGELGLTSGLINTSQQFGSVIGLAVLSGVAAAWSGDGGDLADGTALTTGFSAAFVVGAVAAGVAAIVTAATLRPPSAVQPSAEDSQATDGSRPVPSRHSPDEVYPDRKDS